MNVNSTNFSDLLISEIPSQRLNGAYSGIPIKTLAYKKQNVLNNRTTGFYGSGFANPEYNLSEISEAEDVDGIIKNVIQKKRALINKAGYDITGKNNKTVAYIKQRFLQLSISQGVPMELLIKNTAGDLVRYHNAHWKKHRDYTSSGGKLRKVRAGSDSELEPISAYFRIAPETMYPKVDKNGNLKGWKQIMPDGRSKEYSLDEIIHFTHNKRAGLVFAGPGLSPAVDDIRALRRIEENVEVLIDQNLFPLFVLTIGSDQFPVRTMADGSSEIDVYEEKLKTIPSSGGMVVTHRHKFDVLGTNNIIPVEKYLEHFKKRAYTSCAVSALDMGEGDGMNRSTADNASKILIDNVKDYQDEFRMQFEYEVIYELLLERYDSSCLLEENIVCFEWNEIDNDSMMKLENHNAMMYTMGVLTEDETRRRNNMQVLDNESDREGLFINKYEKAKLDLETEASIKISKAKPVSTGVSGSGTKKKKSATSGAKSSAKNKNTPSNQHGTKLGPENRKSHITTTLLSEKLDKFYLFDSDYTKTIALNCIFSVDSVFADDILVGIDFKELYGLIDSAYNEYNNSKDNADYIADKLISKIVTLTTGATN